MKKIGLLTYHGSHNYGSVLQAYALTTKLKELGYDIELINLRSKNQKDMYKIFKKYNGKYPIIRTGFTALVYHKLKRRFDNYERFINEVLPITKKEYASGKELSKENFDYDMYMCGSDQIWNPACVDFESAYYLDFVKGNKKTIAYAPSLGKSEFDEKTLNRIKSLINNIDYISVREKQGADLIKKITDKNVEVVCDPVSLVEKDVWDKLAVKPKLKKPYILTYFLNNNHGDRSLIKYFQENTGYEVVVLNEYIRDYFKKYNHRFDASPEEFVGLFKYASLIYTNSFHGTVFATIFNKPFFSTIAKNSQNIVNNNDSRKINYLEKVGLSNRIICDNVPSKDEILNINYEEANKKMKDLREESLQYLLNALSSEENSYND